jgi:sugar-specific transcriptional regulator TrmB
MNAEIIKILQTLGLKGTESRVYLALLETGKSLAGTIAERAHLHRRNTYDALEQLLQKSSIILTFFLGILFSTACKSEVPSLYE